MGVAEYDSGSGNGTHYVSPYTRDDGTNVRGYERSNPGLGEQ